MSTLTDTRGRAGMIDRTELRPGDRLDEETTEYNAALYESGRKYIVCSKTELRKHSVEGRQTLFPITMKKKTSIWFKELKTML